MAGKRRSDLSHDRHQRPRAPLAVEPDHVGTGCLQAPARIDYIDIVEHSLVAMHGESNDRRQPRGLHDLECDRCLAIPIDRLRDEKIRALLDSPTNLLLEHRSDSRVSPGVVGFVGIGVADIAGHQAAMTVGDILGDPQGLTVDRFQNLLAADNLELLAMSVVGERLHHIAARMNKILVQAGYDIRVLEHDFRYKGACLKVSTAFEFKEVAFRADDRAGVEPFEQAMFRCRLDCRHRDSLGL